jgi:enterochelin esterase family protein
MKTVSSLFFAIALCTASHAQQALWGGQDIVSPQINNNQTVTFRLQAPQAAKVEVTGDFLPMQKIQTPMGEAEAPGVAALTKNAQGLWEYTTPQAPAPELYSYNFIIDGVSVTDPNNVYMIRDVASVTSLFIIGGGPKADLYRVNDVPHGTLARRWYNSPTLNTYRRITIYTPPGYEQSADDYPVFYLLHGAGGDEEAWISLGRASQILDNLIAQSKARPMIVVMTNGNAGQQAAPGEAPEGFIKPSFMGATRMDGDFEQAFPDVVRFVESNYRAKKQKAARAIAGLSMGGFHSMHTSKQYPDMFDYVGLFSAAIMAREGVTSEVYQDTDAKLKAQFAQKPTLYYIAIGRDDFLFDANTDFRKKLDEANYPYVYKETDGGHIWRNWRIYLSEFLPMLFQTRSN